MYSSSPVVPAGSLVVPVGSGSELGSDVSGSLVVGVLGGAFGVVSIPFSIAVCSSSILNLALKSASDRIYEGIELKTALLYLLKISV